MDDIINIQISDYLTDELAIKICRFQWHTDSPDYVNTIRRLTYDAKYDSDCFHVVAENGAGDVVGCIFCLKNQKNDKLWYYGDLFVSPAYRRMKIATKMIKTATNRINELGGKTIRCYIDPVNEASIRLQRSIGFIEKPYEVFDHLINSGDLMFELDLPGRYHVIPATVNEAIFVCMFYAQNIDALHGAPINFAAWKEILSRDDTDEKTF